MAQDNSGENSTWRREPRPPPPMKFWDASHPIYSNPTVITFGRPTLGSTADSELVSTKPEKESNKPSKILELRAQGGLDEILCVQGVGL